MSDISTGDTVASETSDASGQIHPDVLQNIPVTLSIEVG